ncbi:hypothetical protein PR048_020068 [Dryococelus australis]|uniref:Uncharacterized protein n=1 Tax=Dryococelus australis TaxID=614101 RepID=A0ABQ9H5D1_9NEOP|nr:hypothetical protein PR048_020068 [Dryococelus australis]
MKHCSAQDNSLTTDCLTPGSLLRLAISYVNDPNSFCYVCGEFTFKAQKRSLTPLVKRCYELYFWAKVVDQGNNWAPHVYCSTCVKHLTVWVKGNNHMTFAVPLVRREQKDYSSDCYFYLTTLKGIIVKYHDLSSANRPVPHSKDLHVPKHTTFGASTSSSEPHMITQSKLNDLVRDLNLSKKAAELMASLLKGWNLLHVDTIVRYVNVLQSCNDVCALLEELDHEYVTSEWRLYFAS